MLTVARIAHTHLTSRSGQLFEVKVSQRETLIRTKSNFDRSDVCQHQNHSRGNFIELQIVNVSVSVASHNDVVAAKCATGQQRIGTESRLAGSSRQTPNSNTSRTT
jgi:hypothetical protein